jgi:hypothetical protein
MTAPPASSGPTGFQPLSLGAEDDDDLAVISAVVQDATVRVADLAWEPRRRRFTLMLNRFLWEDQVRKDTPVAPPVPVGGAKGTALARERHWFRVRAGLHFDGVLSVARSGLDPSAGDEVLELLALTHVGTGDGAGTITLVFAGNTAIRLSVECIDCYLRDLGRPWPTANLPDHDLGPPTGAAHD